MTKFGILYDKVPLSLKGVYKYTGGDNYVDGSDKNNIRIILVFRMSVLFRLFYMKQ